VPTFQSTETTTPEKAPICGVLLDICSVPLFGRVRMMFMLHQFLVPRHCPSLFPALLLRLAGGTGGIWLDITKILTLHVASLKPSCVTKNMRPIEWLTEVLKR
jgi:hypothetical protein